MHGNQDGYAAIVRILLLFSIVFVQASCASSAGEPPTVNGNTVSTTDKHQPQSRKLALLVGIDKYQHAHIGNLNGAVNDVHSMKRLLVERFGFPDDNQHLRVLTNSDATADQGTFDDDFVDLGELRGNIGDQNYEIPPDVDLSVYDTVVVWCVRFSTGFTAADLVAA